MPGDRASRILGYIAGSLQVNVPDETFSCHIRDIGSQSETVVYLEFCDAKRLASSTGYPLEA